MEVSWKRRTSFQIRLWHNVPNSLCIYSFQRMCFFLSSMIIIIINHFYVSYSVVFTLYYNLYKGILLYYFYYFKKRYSLMMGAQTLTSDRVPVPSLVQTFFQFVTSSIFTSIFCRALYPISSFLSILSRSLLMYSSSIIFGLITICTIQSENNKT